MLQCRLQRHPLCNHEVRQDQRHAAALALRAVHQRHAAPRRHALQPGADLGCVKGRGAMRKGVEGEGTYKL